MSRKLFSDEEMANLAANPYTSHVTVRQIIFTKEFKERFRIEYRAGKTPAEIIKGCGQIMSLQTCWTENLSVTDPESSR